MPVPIVGVENEASEDDGQRQESEGLNRLLLLVIALVIFHVGACVSSCSSLSSRAGFISSMWYAQREGVVMYV